jgi:hypothetical protein
LFGALIPLRNNDYTEPNQEGGAILTMSQTGVCQNAGERTARLGAHDVEVPRMPFPGVAV